MIYPRADIRRKNTNFTCPYHVSVITTPIPKLTASSKINLFLRSTDQKTGLSFEKNIVYKTHFIYNITLLALRVEIKIDGLRVLPQFKIYLVK